jgi:hypothetical protein
MAYHGDSLTLRMEAAAEFIILRVVILQNFHRHKTVQPVAPRLIYNGHSADTDHFQNFVSVVKQSANILIVIHCLKLLSKP